MCVRIRPPPQQDLRFSLSKISLSAPGPLLTQGDCASQLLRPASSIQSLLAGSGEAPSSSLQPGASLPSPLLLSSPGFSTKLQPCPPHFLCLVPLPSLVCPSLGLHSRLPEIHSQRGDFLLFAISPLPRGEKWNTR